MFIYKLDSNVATIQIQCGYGCCPSAHKRINYYISRFGEQLDEPGRQRLGKGSTVVTVAAFGCQV